MIPVLRLFIHTFAQAPMSGSFF